MKRESEHVTLVSLIRPKFKTGNHLIMARGRLVTAPMTSHYITLHDSIRANINIHQVLEKLSGLNFALPNKVYWHPNCTAVPSILYV